MRTAYSRGMIYGFTSFLTEPYGVEKGTLMIITNTYSVYLIRLASVSLRNLPGQALYLVLIGCVFQISKDAISKQVPGTPAFHLTRHMNKTRQHRPDSSESATSIIVRNCRLHRVARLHASAKGWAGLIPYFIQHVRCAKRASDSP